jgi:hypothetical protein
VIADARMGPRPRPPPRRAVAIRELRGGAVLVRIVSERRDGGARKEVEQDRCGVVGVPLARGDVSSRHELGLTAARESESLFDRPKMIAVGQRAVAARAAVDRVPPAVAGHEGVAPRASDEPIAALITVDRIVTATAEDDVVPCAAVDLVVAGTATYHVVVTRAQEAVGTVRPLNRAPRLCGSGSATAHRSDEGHDGCRDRYRPQVSVQDATSPQPLTYPSDDSLSARSRMQRFDPADNHDALLQASRRVDWRFLLPDRSLGRVACIADDDELADACALFADSVARLRAPEDGERVAFDLAVATASSSLAALVALVQPGGWVYVELRTRNTRACVSALRRLGLVEVQAHWHWPDFRSAVEIVPLKGPRAVENMLLRRHAANPVKAALGRFLLASRLIAFAAPCTSVIGRVSEAAAEAHR